MKQITNKEYEEWLKYKDAKAKSHILLPDTIRLICQAYDYDPENTYHSHLFDCLTEQKILDFLPL